MARGRKSTVFGTDKRIRLGMWGLGRGLSFYKSCAALNIDVVAGCDFNAHMRRRFLDHAPGAFVTDDAETFLDQDFDAVLLATYCPNHAEDAIQCLAAGKHVLSEVTSFHTMAEGVRLIEAVERSGLVYNLAENYPFTRAHMYLADKWRQGLFGELMYAEYEYVHECRSLVYTYIDGVPVSPGWTVHNWRSWLNFHYYNTHSLGPVMYITGTRPTRVVALPGTQRLAGYLQDSPRGMGGIAPSLITMSNGGVVRNLMGATTNDSHVQRIWGTLGAAEIRDGLTLRLGGAGLGAKLEVEPDWPMLADLAGRTGHGGGDFWVLYFFVRQILTGQPAPFDIYAASDCTIPGILACRSSLANGEPHDVPDFRDKRQRARYRNDHWAQKRYDVDTGCFPVRADRKLTGRFTAIMKDLIHWAVTVRAFLDWEKVFDRVREKHKVVALADEVIAAYPAIRMTARKARKLADAYSRSDGARVIREMLEVMDEDQIMRRGALADLKRRRARLKRKAR